MVDYKDIGMRIREVRKSQKSRRSNSPKPWMSAWPISVILKQGTVSPVWRSWSISLTHSDALRTSFFALRWTPHVLLSPAGSGNCFLTAAAKKSNWLPILLWLWRHRCVVCTQKMNSTKKGRNSLKSRAFRPFQFQTAFQLHVFMLFLSRWDKSVANAPYILDIRFPSIRKLSPQIW